MRVSNKPQVQRPPLGDQRFQLGGADVKLTQDGRLTVKGTAGDDAISLRRLDNGTFRLTVNGESKDFGKLQAAKLLGKGGDDKIRIDDRIGIPVVAKGGAGKDDVKRVQPHLTDVFEKVTTSAVTQPASPPLPEATTAPLDYDALLNPPEG